MRVLFASLLFITSTSAFFFGGGAGCGCSAPPACPPPPPPPVPCAGPPPPCGNRGCAVARGAKTAVRQSVHEPVYEQRREQTMQNIDGASERLTVFNVPDDLDYRAAQFGVPIGDKLEHPSAFERLHHLGDLETQLGAFSNSEQVDYNYTPKEDDGDLASNTGGLRRSKEIRRAPIPTVHVHQEQAAETTTVISEVAKIDDKDKLDDVKCNSAVLKKLMLENINDSSSDSKRLINLAAEALFGGSVDVICSRGHFSYIFSSNLFCEASKGLTTCIAFRQSNTRR